MIHPSTFIKAKERASQINAGKTWNDHIIEICKLVKLNYCKTQWDGQNNQVFRLILIISVLVVIAVGDKTINNIGSIRTVAEKWGLSYSIVQRAISGVKEHHQGGRQYDKITGHLKRRSRCKQDEPQAQDELDQEAPPIKKSKTGKGKSSRKTSGKKVQEKKTEKDSSRSDELPNLPF